MEPLTFEKFENEIRPMHNHICILHDCELVRLVGIHRDSHDYYYTVKSIRNRVGKYYASAVGHIVSLKGLYPADRYEYMDKIFSLNGAEEEKEFLITEDTHDRFNDEMDQKST